MCVDPSIRMSQTDSYWNVSRGLVTALWLGRWTLSLNIGWHIFLFFRSTFSSTLRSTSYPSCPHVACVLLVTFLSLFFSFCFVSSIWQLMQQQAALMAASHGGYLAPSVAFPTTQIHQMGALNINSLPPTPMTPVSGEFHQTLGEQQRFISSLTGWGRSYSIMLTGPHTVSSQDYMHFKSKNLAGLNQSFICRATQKNFCAPI